MGVEVCVNGVRAGFVLVALLHQQVVSAGLNVAFDSEILTHAGVVIVGKLATRTVVQEADRISGAGSVERQGAALGDYRHKVITVALWVDSARPLAV